MDGNLHQIPYKFYKQIINIEKYFQKKSLFIILYIIGFKKNLKDILLLFGDLNVRTINK